MMKNYMKIVVVALAMMATTTVSAVEFPCAKAPVDGQTYILANLSNPTNYWTRTSWDGAYYLLSYNDAKDKLGTFTAHQAENGSWYFTVENGEEGVSFGGNTYYGTTYVGIPAGTDNINAALYDPAYWIVESSDKAGFYMLKAGEGQGNDLTIGGYLHLNGGNQYAIINESTSAWFPDYYGGIQVDENGIAIYDDTGFVIPLNPISRYWAFISPDDLDAYTLKIDLYSLLQDIEDNYLSLADYAEGFKGALDFSLPYYNKADITADDVDAVKTLVNAKMNLYKEIINAIELLNNGNPSASFSNAINTAISTFNTSNDAAVLKAALAALQDAERIYVMATDDLTALVKNNSFEDLQSQGGNMTSGVAAAPYGWNVYVRGKQVTTASEVQAAGITAWHGINNDAEGALDGDYAFGLWTSGVPEYEISQTIEGLENGTYVINAALMVGANGNGSRRTTQRIFGNLNSTYFAGPYDYDESRLDQGEVYGFQGLEEPVTDRMLQEMEVRAFVYDGTLTLGLRTNGDIAAANRTSSNGAGGDGWFKLDNFRILKVGYVQEDALAVYNHFAKILTAFKDNQIQKSILTQIDQLTKGSIGTGSTQEEIIAAILALRELYPLAQSSVKAYASLEEAINKGYAALLDYPLSSYIYDFGDIIMEAEDMYGYCLAGEEEIAAMIARIMEGIEELKATAVGLGDITFILKNPGFEDLSNQGNSESNGSANPPSGWTLKVNGEVVTSAPGFGWCAINNGDAIDVTDEDGTYYDHQYTEGTHVWGIWNGSIPEIELSQTLKNLPKGAYTLKADVMVQNQWAGNCLTTQRIFANDYVQMWGYDGYYEMNMPADALNAKVLTYAGYSCDKVDGLMDNQQPTSLLRPMEVHFDVLDDGVAVIGFRTNGINPDGTPSDNGHGWFKLDNFRLSYDSEELLSVDGIEQQKSATTAFYSLDGRRLQAPQRGINIMKTADKTVKVMVK